MEIKDFILHVIETLDVENCNEVTAETDFHDLEEWSSMSGMRLIAMIESEYEVLLSPMDIRNSSSIENLFNIINNRRNG